MTVCKAQNKVKLKKEDIVKISLNWLSKYIDLKKHKTEDLVKTLTSAGLEVEHVEDRAKNYKHIVIGQIDQLTKHPMADRLTLCKVTTSANANDIYEIICGATNHRQGDKVVLAMPGSILPNGLEIKPVFIKGHQSNGMLCSEEELGLNDKSEGIMILPKDAPLGSDFAEYRGLDDVVLDINVTSNRADCLSHLGLARELATLLGIPYKSPAVSLQTKSIKNAAISVVMLQKEIRYAGRVITGVQVKESPSWLVRCLESVGSSSINNIVDVTNFVMLELGQPLHAFDIRCIEGGQIQVDLAKPQESFVTLDGTEIKLDGTETMIRDTQKPLALAGIVGGKNSGVYQDTVDVFIESAVFRSDQIRRTSRKFGIETESSYRFARGVDPNTTLLAMNCACQLIQEVAGGQVQEIFYDFYPQPVTRASIFLNAEEISSRLGYSIDIHRCCSLLKSLGCKVHFGREDSHQDPMNVGLLKSLGCQSQLKEEDASLLTVIPPTYRQDISIKEDLIEEIARLEGYHKIPNGKVLTSGLVRPHAREYLLQRQLNDIIRRQGYQQTISLAFCNSKTQQQLLGQRQTLIKAGFDISDSPVALSNPLSQELDIMRQSLLPGLINVLAHNCRHKINYGRIYEMGYTFQNFDRETTEKQENYDEKWHLGFIAWGYPLSPWQKNLPPVVLELKQHITNILKALNITSYQWKTADSAIGFLHHGQAAFLFCEGKNVGYIGTVNPKILKQYKVTLEAVCAELNLDRLLAHFPRKLKAKEFSRFPSVERDISILVERNVEVGSILQLISKIGGQYLQSATLFDIYEDAKTTNKKSLAFRLIYQKKETTLEEEEVNQIQTKIIKSLEQKFHIQLRT